MDALPANTENEEKGVDFSAWKSTCGSDLTPWIVVPTKYSIRNNHRPAQFSDGLLATEALQNNADLLFGRKLAAGPAFDLSDDLLRILLLGHGTLHWSGDYTLECPLI